MTIAYVYKWTHLPTLKWYVGSRSRKNCHPGDGYICTQEYVCNAVKWYPSEWKREIIATGSKEEMQLLEDIILQTIDARADNRSFNQSNNDGRYGGKGRPLGYKVSEESRKNYIRANREKAKNPKICAKFARPRTPEWKENISNALKGFKRGPMSEEQKKLRSEANKLAWAKKKSQVQI